MEEKKNLMTYQGVRTYEEELQHLKVVRRKEIAEKIREAREQGDLSENAEYDAALDEQREIESRITELEEILKNAVVIDEDEMDSGKINIGCTVTLLDVEFDEEVTFSIVGTSEGTSSLSGRIANESPLGSALIGKAVGDTVTVEAPGGEFTYKVLKIERI